MSKLPDLTLENWQERLKLAISFREKFSDCKNWEKYKSYYRHQYPEVADGKQVLPYNIFFGFANTLLPSVYFSDPYIVVRPRKADTPREFAWMVESLDNFLLKKMKIRKLIKQLCFDNLYAGFGVGKIGYEKGVFQRLDEDADLFLSVIDPKDKEEYQNYNIRVEPDMPWILRQRPEDTFLPYGTETFDDVRWTICRVVKPLDEVKADDLYQNTKELKGTLEYPDNIKKKEFYMQQGDFVELYEIYDFQKRMFGVFAAGHDKWLVKPQESPEMLDPPNIKFLSFSHDADWCFPTPEFKVLEPLQQEMTETRTQMMKHRKIALLKVLVEKGSIPNIEQLLRGDVGTIVEVEGLQNAVQFLQSQVPQDQHIWMQEIRKDAAEILGMSEPAMGQFHKGRRTATEAAMVGAGYDTRVGDKRVEVRAFLESVIEKANDIVFSRWDTEVVQKVLGMDGLMYWVSFKPADLKGDYELKIDVDAMSPMTQGRRRQELMGLLQTIGGIEGVNIRPLLQDAIRDFGFDNVEAILPEAPQEGPMDAREFQQKQSQVKPGGQALKQGLSRRAR